MIRLRVDSDREVRPHSRRQRACEKGGSYSALDTQALIEYGQKNKDKPTADAVLVLNHKRAAEYLWARNDTSSRIGAIGFCYGGGVCNLLASRLPWLGAAVPFYGAAVTADEAKTIKAALQLHFAQTDERINAAWPAFENELVANHVSYEAHHYSGTQHGFHNGTTPRYDETAAKLAWSRAIRFFKQHLR